ncbi:MAG: hypothetical protein LBP51_06970 [Deferribacteraceae bacterium]|jgi:hypothetical protein|nr:hypothetical protein [Deferribacteraceae bacterium]
MFSYLLLFYSQGRRFDRGDKAGEVFRSVGEMFDAPMSTSTKVIALLMLAAIAVFSTYFAIRIIRHIWHEK